MLLYMEIFILCVGFLNSGVVCAHKWVRHNWMFRRRYFVVFIEFFNYSFINTYDRRVVGVTNRKTVSSLDLLVF